MVWEWGKHLMVWEWGALNGMGMWEALSGMGMGEVWEWGKHLMVWEWGKHLVWYGSKWEYWLSTNISLQSVTIPFPTIRSRVYNVQNYTMYRIIVQSVFKVVHEAHSRTQLSTWCVNPVSNITLPAPVTNYTLPAPQCPITPSTSVETLHYVKSIQLISLSPVHV